MEINKKMDTLVSFINVLLENMISLQTEMKNMNRTETFKNKLSKEDKNRITTKKTQSI